MIETLQQLILDGQAASPRPSVPRRVGISAVPGKATVCIGVRRSGKSTVLEQIGAWLRDNGASPEDFLALNFFDDRLHGLAQTGLAPVIEAYFGLYPEKQGKETVYCFFDEIQAIPNWEPFIDRLMRTEKCAVYLTGSSARMLSKEIATQMRGRAISWEVFPFSFREFLDSRGIGSKFPLSTRSSRTIASAFEEFWQTGGFPEVVAQPVTGDGGGFEALSPQLRVKTHQEYLEAILFRDLVERHDISHPKALRDLAHRLLDNAGSLYTVSSLNNHLKSLGHKTYRELLNDYLAWFEDAYFLFTVPSFDGSRTKRDTRPKKIYCVDHALVRSVSPRILVNSGHMLENLVFTALRRLTPEIYYYNTRSGGEVDFLSIMTDGGRRLVQVCESLADEKTRTREVRALSQAMEELGLDEGVIVTRGKEPLPADVSEGIRIVPVWKFLLEMDGVPS